MATSGKSSSSTQKKTTKSKAGGAKPSRPKSGGAKAASTTADATKAEAAKFATGRGKADAVMAAVQDSKDDPAVQAQKAPNDATLVLKDAIVEPDDAKVEADKKADSVAEEKSSDIERAEVEIPTAAPVQEKQGSTFFPMFFGGLVAAAIGFGAALMLFPDGINGTAALERSVTSQGEAVSALQSDMAAVDARIEALASDQSSMAVAVNELSQNLTSLSDQIANAPQADPSLLSDELAATLAAQKGELARLQGELEKMAAFAQSQIDAAEAEQVSAEQAQARVTARGALNTVRDALASGDPFANALPDIAAAVDVPAGLAASAETGVASQSALEDDFADAARAALSASVRETAGDTTGSRLKLFLQDQLGARSLTPREGDDPDAVLSRAEAALKAGDIPGALDLISNLPESGQAALAEWNGKASARQAAIAGYDEISNALSEN